jgi:hypothetical protein
MEPELLGAAGLTASFLPERCRPLGLSRMSRIRWLPQVQARHVREVSSSGGSPEELLFWLAVAGRGWAANAPAIADVLGGAGECWGRK